MSFRVDRGIVEYEPGIGIQINVSGGVLDCFYKRAGIGNLFHLRGFNNNEEQVVEIPSKSVQPKPSHFRCDVLNSNRFHFGRT